MMLALLSAYAVFLVAIMSPGPDFAVTVRNSVRHGRRAGVCTAFGIACGNLVHISYVSIGLGAVIAHSIVAFNVMKFVAAIYLAYIGIKALRSRPQAVQEDRAISAPRPIPDRQAFMQGLVTSALNPKAALFWLSYFTVVLDPHMSFAALAGFVALLMISVVAWFSIVSHFLSRLRVREKFLKLGHWFDRATGAVLIALGVKVALARR